MRNIVSKIVFALLILLSISLKAQQDTVFFYLAEKAQKESDHHKAIELYTKAIELCAPNSAELRQSYIYRAIEKFSFNDFYGAIDDINQAIPIQVKTSKIYWVVDTAFFRKKDNEFVYFFLGDCYINIGEKEKACLSYSRAGELGDSTAYERINQHCGIENQDENYYIELASAQRQNSEYSSALETIKKAEELYPNDAVVYVVKGSILHDTGNYDESIKSFNKAISLNSSNFVVFLLRGMLYQVLDKDELAILDYNRALALKPANSDLYLYRGWANGNLGKFSSAINDFNTAIKYNDKNSEAYYRKALALFATQNSSAGCESLKISYALGNEKAYSKIENYCSSSSYSAYNYSNDYTPCIRTGATCFDGWISDATGQGACSHHGGVYEWICE